MEKTKKCGKCTLGIDESINGKNNVLPSYHSVCPVSEPVLTAFQIPRLLGWFCFVTYFIVMEDLEKLQIAHCKPHPKQSDFKIHVSTHS